ncbi:hypothetical protein LPJ56_005512, partial [Coemansia sp. RSA 2599]
MSVASGINGTSRAPTAVSSTPASVSASASVSTTQRPTAAGPPSSSASQPAAGPRMVRAMPMGSGPGNSRPMGAVNGSMTGAPMRMVHNGNSVSSTGAGPSPAARLPPQRISNGASQQPGMNNGALPRPGATMVQRRPQQPMPINRAGGSFVAAVGPRPRPAQTTSGVPPQAAPVRRPMASPNAAASKPTASTAPRQPQQQQQSQQQPPQQQPPQQ